MFEQKQIEGKVWEEVFRLQHRKQYATHRIVDTYPAQCEEANKVTINIISTDEMRRHGLETGHRRAQHRRRLRGTPGVKAQ